MKRNLPKYVGKDIRTLVIMTIVGMVVGPLVDGVFHSEGLAILVAAGVLFGLALKLI